ncbi:alpha/beta hydrolase [Bacillus massiliglaciei]|uniref:alpha/beta hydrolase n=1 Tax=Bacillus massiliglaciei TaxID=1816693 RepID=UPI000A5F1B6C|nr:alpha/beta hydrolase [Bacillus massiliglaciei]
MPVNSDIQKFLDQYNSVKRKPMDEITPEEFRNGQVSYPQKKEPVKETEDRILQLGGRNIPVRIYRPEGSGEMPALVYYHGGGWVTGSIDSHDPICRVIANTAECAVISVDYRLAPEHPFPAAVHDAYDSLLWIYREAGRLGIDKKRIAVGGDSAGGNLAAVACIMAKERKTPEILHQLLIYPSTGYTEEPPSMKENAQGYLLTKETMKWFRKHYFTHQEDERNPYASPILYPKLSGLPPATIITAEYDPLRDVGKAYGEKLKNHGVPVTYLNYPDLIHGFASFIGFVPAALTALEEGAKELKQALGKI